MKPSTDSLATELAPTLLDALSLEQRRHVAAGNDPQGSGDLVTWAGAALLGLVLRELGTPGSKALTLSRRARGTVAFAFALQSACRVALVGSGAGSEAGASVGELG